MSQTQTPKQYAVGENEMDDCVCPAVAAGLNPGYGSDLGGVLEAAEWYDKVAENHITGYQGSINADLAKQSWIQMLESANRSGHTETATAAAKIAERLGWIEAGDYELLE